MKRAVVLVVSSLRVIKRRSLTLTIRRPSDSLKKEAGHVHIGRKKFWSFFTPHFLSYALELCEKIT